MERRFSKRPMGRTTVRVAERDLELLYVAAKREGLSQSEFLRQAIREHSKRVLLEEPEENDE